jgi:hypothetical protein
MLICSANAKTPILHAQALFRWCHVSRASQIDSRFEESEEKFKLLGIASASTTDGHDLMNALRGLACGVGETSSSFLEPLHSLQ